MSIFFGCISLHITVKKSVQEPVESGNSELSNGEKNQNRGGYVKLWTGNCAILPDIYFSLYIF